MAPEELKRLLSRREEKVRRVRVLLGDEQPDLAQVVPYRRLDEQIHRLRTSRLRASQSAVVGWRPEAFTRWRNNRSVSGSNSKSGAMPSQGNNTARLPFCSISVASPAIALATNSSARAFNVATSTVLTVRNYMISAATQDPIGSRARAGTHRRLLQAAARRSGVISAWPI
jgi:hypothetical protein